MRFGNFLADIVKRVGLFAIGVVMIFAILNGAIAANNQAKANLQRQIMLNNAAHAQMR